MLMGVGKRRGEEQVPQYYSRDMVYSAHSVILLVTRCRPLGPEDADVFPFSVGLPFTTRREPFPSSEGR